MHLRSKSQVKSSIDSITAWPSNYKGENIWIKTSFLIKYYSPLHMTGKKNVATALYSSWAQLRHKLNNLPIEYDKERDMWDTRLGKRTIDPLYLIALHILHAAQHQARVQWRELQTAGEVNAYPCIDISYPGAGGAHVTISYVSSPRQSSLVPEANPKPKSRNAMKPDTLWASHSHCS